MNDNTDMLLGFLLTGYLCCMFNICEGFSVNIESYMNMRSIYIFKIKYAIFITRNTVLPTAELEIPQFKYGFLCMLLNSLIFRKGFMPHGCDAAWLIMRICFWASCWQVICVVCLTFVRDPFGCFSKKKIYIKKIFQSLIIYAFEST
jgi:hypothetical protein